MNGRWPWAVLLALAITAPGGMARGQDGADADSTAADSTAADSTATDSTDALRKFLSTDGAVSVYEEAAPGEGIEGFWWEYQPDADLQRLLDKDQRNQKLETLTDAFGFDLVIPDSIRALRDSVTAVADSILASRIEFETSFDPKLRTQYTERRDDFELSNEFDSPIPLTRRTTLSTRLKDTQRFNRSTSKVRDDRNLSSTFTFRYSERVSSTLSATRTSSQQHRGKELENKTGQTGLQGRAQARFQSGLFGTVELSSGLAVNSQDYQTPRTTGSSGSFQPTWGGKLSRPYEGGAMSLDYTGNLSRGTRTETHPEFVTQPDSSVVEESVRNQTEESNRNDKLNLSGNYKVAEGWDLRVNASSGREKVQFIAQADSIVGQQETRTGQDSSVRLNLDAKPITGLEVRSSGSMNLRKTEYDLETGRYARTVQKNADSEFRYEPWTGGNLTAKLARQHEAREFRTAQAGTVEKQSASLDYRQKLTSTIDLNGGWFISLDSFAFDDTNANTGDRDLLTQRGTFTVRYTPKPALSTSVKMDLRESQSVNIHPLRSGDNKTDYTYVITPTYTLKIGAASINGEFTADARYAVFDFDEDRNSLTRRFGTRQRWQQAFTPRVSTDLLGTFDFSDEGSYKPIGVNGARLFERSRENHRFRVDAQIQYSPREWFRGRAVYRKDGDDNYRLDEDGVRSLAARSRTNEFTFGFTIKRKLVKTIQLDLDLSRTEKVGDRVTAADRQYFEIRASVEYQPLKSPGGGS